MMVEPKTKQQMLKIGIDGSECSSPEVSPKRMKMESGSGSSTSGSAEGKELPPKRNLINTETQNFAIIKNMPGFVDHTHFIGSFLSEEDRKLAIFAPRRFGKSSHLNMVKTFVSCADTVTHAPYANMKRPAKERENYELFKDTRIIKDGKLNDILEQHLGKHPVIHLDFKSAPTIRDVKDAENHFRKVVHNAYEEHPYLITSQKLDADDSEANAENQEICKRWCSNSRFKNEDLSDSLDNLAKFLYNHFDGAKVYVLIDEFDAINESALRNVEGDVEEQVKKIEQIGKVVTSPLGWITKGNNNVAGALITGVSYYIAGVGFNPDMNNFKKFRFLEGDSVLPDDKDFVPFYGATKAEVRNVVVKLVQDDHLEKFNGKEQFVNDERKLDVEKIMLDLESRYNGYLDKKGTPIFCLWSVLQYLQSGKPKNFWSETEGFGKLRNIFRSAAIAKDVLKLMRGETITFERRNNIHINQLLELEKLMNKKKENANCTIALNFLIDQGFVSYAENKVDFKMPNPEIRAAFSKMLFDILKDERLDPVSCAEVLNKLSGNEDEETLQKEMLVFYKLLKYELKKLLKSKNLDHVNEILIVCMLHGIMLKADAFEFTVDSRIKVDGKLISSGRPDYFLKHKSGKFFIILEVKANLKEKDGKKRSNRTSNYACQEAMGKELTTKKKIKDYMEAVEKLKLKALVIGLSVDGNFNVSMTYASNDKTFCITKREHELHPDYYKDCIILPYEESDSECNNDSDTQ